MPAGRQAPPPGKGMKPMDYYKNLISMGFSPWEAANAMQGNYGSPEQYAAKGKEKAAWAQVGGQIAGIGAGLAINEAFSSPSTSSNVQTPVVKDARMTGSSGQPNAGSAPVTEVASITMPDGSPGILMSDGAKVGQNGKIINSDGTYGGSLSGQALAAFQVAGGAAQAYNGYKQYQSGEKLGGAANVAGGAYGIAAGTQSLASGGTAGSLSGYAPGVGTTVAAAQIGQQMLNEKGSSEDRAAKSQAEAQKAALLWIPGYGWVAYAALAGLDAISGGKATEGLMKFNKAAIKLTDKIDLGLGKSIRSKVFHQSTKGVQEMHTGQLLQQSDDPTWQNYVVGMRTQVKEGPKDKTKPFAGKYASFDEYKKAGLQANDLTGVYGNLDTFKPDYADKAGVPHWAKLTPTQQQAVTQRLIDENMYSSKKGEVVIRDKEKARRIYEEMAKTNFKGGPSPMQTPSVPAIPKTEIPKSTKPKSLRDVLELALNKQQEPTV